MKNLFFGVAIAAIALTASAFTNAKVASGDHYVQTGPNTWQRVTSPAVFNPTLCEQLTQQPCYFTQDANDNSDYGSTLTSEQIATINGSTMPLKLAPSTTRGIYDGDIN